MATNLKSRLDLLEQSLEREIASIVCIPLPNQTSGLYFNEIAPGIFIERAAYTHSNKRQNRTIYYSNAGLLNDWLGLPAQAIDRHCVYRVLKSADCQATRNQLEADC